MPLKSLIANGPLENSWRDNLSNSWRDNRKFVLRSCLLCLEGLGGITGKPVYTAIVLQRTSSRTGERINALADFFFVLILGQVNVIIQWQILKVPLLRSPYKDQVQDR